MFKRIIPSVQLEDNVVVKSKMFAETTYVGEPINVIKIFNDKFVDELIIIDISKTTSPNFEVLEELTSEAFMPLTYSGKINKLEYASKLFEIGFEKISLTTAAIYNPDLIIELVKKYGSQSICVCVDIKKLNQDYYVYSHLKNEVLKDTSINEFISFIADCGVGEIIVQSVDRDGTKTGFDIDLLKTLLPLPRVPVLFCGGCSSIDDLNNILSYDISGVVVGSYFTLYGPYDAPLIHYVNESLINERM